METHACSPAAEVTDGPAAQEDGGASTEAPTAAPAAARTSRGHGGGQGGHPRGSSVRGLRSCGVGQGGPRGDHQGGLGAPCRSFVAGPRAAAESNTASGEDGASRHGAGASKQGTG
jgi:hypothetical protein